MIFFGTSQFGRVDEVPNTFHVSTSFFHVYYIPLIPYGSYLVFRESAGQFEGVKIGLSGRSVLAAWGKAFAFITLAISFILTLLRWGDWRQGQPIMPMLTAAAIAGVSLAAFLFLHNKRGIRYARRERAMDLARQAGVFSQMQPILEAHFNALDQAAAARAQSRANDPRSDSPGPQW